MSDQVQPRVAVVGLWHLGSVIAGCVADPQWPTLGIEPDAAVVEELRHGRPPLFEPGLEDLLAAKLAADVIDFAGPDDARIAQAEIVWVTFDTPVDDDDRADVEFVLGQTEAVLRHAGHGVLVVISSQMPVGSAAVLSDRLTAAGRGDLRYACVPENLRLGRAIETFSAPERFVAGVADDADREQLATLLGRFCDQIEWMSVESAEMTKHALNAFLATSVAFINEIAVVCERVGADAAEVSRGLKSERRIGPGAYLSPGDAFAGGTLARDITFIAALADEHGVPAHIATGVGESNREHRGWARRTLQARLGGDAGLTDARIAVWGLTYKPGTNTLRRSSAVDFATRVHADGATVVAYDPAITELPAELDGVITLAGSATDAARGAGALVIFTPVPEFREVAAADVVDALDRPLVLDAAGHTARSLGQHAGIDYLRVGSPLT